MLTRGYFIGEVVDDLATLGGQIKMRNAIHMFDLTVAAENFFRDVLNIILGANFKNLNATRSNEPGLDLGDDKLKIGIQVTSSATSAKIKNTLKKITTNQYKKYNKIYVLGLNPRQRKYSFDKNLAKKYKFSSDNVWDLDTLVRKAFDLPIDKLQELYNFVHSSSARLKIELEVPDKNGKYPTSGYEMWEQRAKPKLGNGDAFCSFIENKYGEAPERDEIKKALEEFAARLICLPRVTREFLSMLFERREKSDSKRFHAPWSHLLLSKVRREYSGHDLEGEFDILRHAEFLNIEEEDIHDFGAVQIGIIIPTESDELSYDFVSFVDQKNLKFRDVIGAVDLSAF